MEKTTENKRVDFPNNQGELEQFMTELADPETCEQLTAEELNKGCNILLRMGIMEDEMVDKQVLNQMHSLTNRALILLKDQVLTANERIRVLQETLLNS